MPFKPPPSILNGAIPVASRQAIETPILSNGSIILPIGLFRIDLSPSRVVENGRPASIPDINRILVPEFPTYRFLVGSLSSPPCTCKSSDPISLSCAPRELRISIVCLTSWPLLNPWIVDSPSAKEASMRIR